MKRSAALASLSRDHHQALVVAQQLRRATDATAAEARAAFLAYWAGHGRLHFRLEEELLFPPTPRRSPRRCLPARVERVHARTRAERPRPDARSRARAAR